MLGAVALLAAPARVVEAATSALRSINLAHRFGPSGCGPGGYRIA
jgi:hypothetical protein